MSDPASYLIPPGVLMVGDRSKPDLTIHPVDPNDPGQIQEFVSHSWYDYTGGKGQGLHPYDGETALNYNGRGGPKPPYKQLNVDDGYSWLKSPRWMGKAVEVGPLARVLVLYASGHAQTKELVGMTLKTLDVPVRALFSTLGRTAARTLETKVIADHMQVWFDNLMGNIRAGDTRTFNADLWDPSTWPKEARGVGHMEAPRGGLAHWIVIKDGKIDNYQAVVPSTWNAGPRDGNGQPGAYEAALQDNHELHDPTQPVEILRTIHSFDPCIACAVHLSDEEGDELLQLRVR
jgi:hydrogenase large subunit